MITIYCTIYELCHSLQLNKYFSEIQQSTFNAIWNIVYPENTVTFEKNNNVFLLFLYLSLYPSLYLFWLRSLCTTFACNALWILLLTLSLKKHCTVYVKHS